MIIKVNNFLSILRKAPQKKQNKHYRVSLISVLENDLDFGTLKILIYITCHSKFYWEN